MVLLTVVAVATLALTALAQVLALVACARVFLKPAPSAKDQDLPRAAVVMALKGVDPFLSDNLLRLMRQDFPEYEIRIVVDSASDPAWDVVHRAISESGAEHVTVATDRHDPENGATGLVNSAIVQGLRAVSSSVDVVAFADGDLSTHPRWLRELVQPLAEAPDVAVTFGNRWYLPPEGRFGSLVRHANNALAVLSMYLQRSPWGGCMALRTDFVQATGLLDEWARVIAFDAAAPRLLKRHGKRLVFVPSLMMVNREECSLRQFFAFHRRQLTWSMLYHSKAWIALPAACEGLALTAAGVLGSSALILGHAAVAAASFGAIAGYFAIRLAVVASMELLARRSIRRQGMDSTWLSPGKVIRLMGAVLTSPMIHYAAVLSCLARKAVTWRGRVLKVRGPHDFEIVADESELQDRQGANVSL